MLVESTTFYNNFVNFSPNVTKFDMLIDIGEIDKSHDLCCYGNHFAGNYEFRSYQNMCIYKMAWHSINTIARLLNHILLERAGD